MKKDFITLEEFKTKALQDPGIAREYEKIKDTPIEFSIREISLSEIRKALGITQKELAEKTGFSQSDISKMEQGKKRLPMKRLRQLADGMGMEVKIHITFVPKDNE